MVLVQRTVLLTTEADIELDRVATETGLHRSALIRAVLEDWRQGTMRAPRP